MRPIAFALRTLRYLRRNGRYWTARKAANAALAHLAMRLKLTYTPAGPVMAKIEATNICNGTCRLCPVGRKEPGCRPYGMMAWPLYRKLIDELKDTVVTVDLTNWGESLLHPRILEMIRYAHDARMYTYLSTNLHTVRPEHIEGLMRCGLDELALSIHGLSEETYQAYQPGFSFAEADDRVARLAEARTRISRDGRPKIKLNFVVTAKNAHEADDVETFAGRYGMEYVLSEASLNLRFKISPEMVRSDPDAAKAIVAEQVDEWMPEPGRYDRSIYRELLDRPEAMYDGAKRFACDWPWKRLVVNHDGGAGICCGSYYPGEDVGRYEGQPVRQLWNSEPYRRSRRSFGCRGARQTPRVLCEQCPGVLL